MIAPFVICRQIYRNVFETHMERLLVPELRRGDVAIMDNLSSHKGPMVRALIEAAGEKLLFHRPC